MQINRYTRQILTERKVADTVDASAISRAGETAGVFADISGQISRKMNDTSDSLWLTETMAKKTKARIDMEQAERLKFTDNPEGFAGYFESKLIEIDNDFMKTAPSEAAKMSYQKMSIQDNTNIYATNKNWENTARIQSFERKAKTIDEDLNNAAYTLGASGQDLDPDILGQADSASVALANIMSPEQIAEYNKASRQQKYDQYLRGLSKANPQKVIESIKKGEYSLIPENATFDDAVKSIFKIEGGYVADDAGAGPTLFGINSRANPKEFEQIMGLYNAGKQKEAKDLATKVYKTKYWDAINADKLDPQFAYVAVDAAVNHGVGAAKEMIAQAGGDVFKFLDLRRSRYQSLAENNPDKAPYLKGWMNRVDMLEERLGGGVLPEEEIQKIYDMAENEKRKLGQEYKYTLSKDMDVIEKALSVGAPVDNAKLDELIANAESYDLKDERDALVRVKKTQSAVIDFAKMPLKEQQDDILARRNQIKNGDFSKIDEYESLVKAYDNKTKLVKSAPWAYYAEAGTINQPMEFDKSSPDAFAMELTKRRASVDIVKQKDGVTIPILTENELTNLMASYESGDINRFVNDIAPFSQSLNAQELASVASSFKDKSPLMAAVMAKADDMPTAKRILEGSRIENFPVSAQAVATGTLDKLGNAILDPSALNSAQTAVYAMYKQLSVEVGVSDTKLDDAILEASVKAVIGEVDNVTISGTDSKIIIPKDMTPNDIEDVVASLDDISIKDLAGLPFAGTTLLNADDVRSARMVTVGDGVYSFIIDDITGGYITDENGKLFKIDVKAAQDYLNNSGKMKSGQKYSQKEDMIIGSRF